MDGMQKKVGRNRKPRVHITMEVETGGAQKQVEIPFVVGVMGDYSGNAPKGELKPLKERKFVGIGKENFNEVLKKMAPGLNFTVDNVMDPERDTLSVDLKFESMGDFDPAAVARQIPELRALLEQREKLKELAAQAERSEEVENLLEQILSNNEALKKASERYADGEPAGDGEGESKE